MARMIPDFETDEVSLARAIPESHDGYNAEREVYRIMKNELPATWTVLYDINLGQRYGNHQIDFLVIVPGKGIVNVDAKGKNYTYRKARWSLGNTPRDIVGEAKGAIFALGNLMHDKKIVFNDQWGAFSWLLAFAFDDFDVDLEMTSIQQTGLHRKGQLQTTIEQLLDTFNYNFQYFTKDIEKRLIGYFEDERIARAPYAEFVQNDNTQKMQLSYPQQLCYNTIKDNTYVHIRGGAGTGKTVIAKEVAISFAQEGRKVLYVCYNRKLAESMQLESRCMDLINKGNLEILSYYQIGPALTGNKSMNVFNGQEIDTAQTDQNYETVIKQRGELHTNHGVIRGSTISRYNVLLIDEAQDLTGEQNKVLLSLVYSGRNNLRRVAWFSDVRQAIYNPQWKSPQDLFPDEEIKTPEPLGMNIRNTDAIFMSFRSPDDNTMPGRFLKGEPVETTDEQISQILARLHDKGYQPGDIAILANRKEDLPRNADWNNSGFSCSDNLSTWKKDQTVLISTIHAFKGLEANCVILLLRENAQTPETFKELEYIGRSRAKYKLIVKKLG